jgi:hypothetical protein
MDGTLHGHPPFDSQCASGRRPLTIVPSANRTYHHFDDVLLVVFFSHARYDVNLDYYRAVYADYFPNVELCSFLLPYILAYPYGAQIVFVGPKTREDLGSQHSYDVLVDSYQSDEDLSDPKDFKMAGRVRLFLYFQECSLSYFPDGPSYALYRTSRASLLLRIPLGPFRYLP